MNILAIGKGIVKKPRGIIMAADLINDGAMEGKAPKQWANYAADFGVDGEGRCNFPVFEGFGNHDVSEKRFIENKIKNRNQKRMELGYIDHLSENGYHYSWDWEGILFVNVNIFPGNQWHGEADAYGRAHDPLHARDFMAEDLKDNVGNTGRPVVIVQHFRPIDYNWWTKAAADKAYRVLQDYNVVLIMCGHQGGGMNNTWRGIDWASSNGRLQVFHITKDTLTGLVRKEAEWSEIWQKPMYFSYERSGLPAVVNNGDWAVEVSGNKTEFPVWVKLVRNGDTFTGYISNNGKTWKQVDDPMQIDMEKEIQAGLAVTAGNVHDCSKNQTGTFSAVKVE